jgi:hypothetical protein
MPVKVNLSAVVACTPSQRAKYNAHGKKVSDENQEANYMFFNGTNFCQAN